MKPGWIAALICCYALPAVAQTVQTTDDAKLPRFEARVGQGEH
jgi:hypothetical protein